MFVSLVFESWLNLKENVSEEEHDDDEEFDDTDDYEDDVSDDDDGGEWKVRRSAIRVISSVVESFKHDLFKLWSEEYIWKKNRRKTTVAGALVDRFKEREESWSSILYCPSCCQSMCETTRN